ncbi:HNH endonuclease [Komagataeibacter oboediens]|uniref:HNH endonuclease n=1 Tax=Komagataeibacter oboediens TaxID=65958 RepID=UPI0023DA60CB|nr:HNH endonuclease [Komagataeibacter oboediens]WEQ50994.1 HNH endonuclease [Komagataeibacter oboediens]
MIELQKGPEPKILSDHAAEWTKALLKTIAEGKKPTAAEQGHYRHREIKEALKSETFRKCAYCESMFLHTGFGHIEHITPKSSKPELSFEWKNLTLACEICNVNKGTEEVIDPYEVNPDDHFAFEGPVIIPKPGSDIGFASEKQLKLNRAELIEYRKKKRDDIYFLIEAFRKSTNNEKKDAIRKLINERISKESEYSAMMSHLAKIYM